MLPQHRDNRIRVLLVDDSKIIREAVRNVLDDNPGIHVVGEADNKIELFRVLRETNPDVLVVDLHLCAESDVLSALWETQGLGILVMSALVGQESMALAARLGIREVLEKADLADTLMNAIENAYSQRQTRRMRVAIAS